MLKYVFKNKMFICLMMTFIFVFIFSLLIPYGGDDFGNYFFKHASLTEIVNGAINKYMLMEGRFFSRIADYLLVPHPVFHALLNAILMSALIYMIYKIIGSNNKYLLTLIILAILLVDMQVFAQVFVWKTGNVTYFIPMIFMIFLIYIRKDLPHANELKQNKFEYGLIPLTLIFSMFVENVSIGIILVCILNIISYYKKYHKIDLPMLFCLFAAIIGTIIMLISPGNSNRMHDNVDFSELSLIGKIIYNIPNLISYTFVRNSFLILLMQIVMFVICYRYIKNKPLKYLTILYILIIPTLTIIAWICNHFITHLPRIFSIILDTSRWYIDIYWILFLILFLVLIFWIFKNKNTFKLLYFIILAAASNGVMMISPTWGGRTSCLTIFMLYIVLFIILIELDLHFLNKTNILINIFTILIATCLMIYAISTHILNNYRANYINYQLKEKVDAYEIIIVPTYYAWNLNTWGSDGDFAINFKKYYKIPADAELIYVKSKDVPNNVKCKK